MRRREQVVKMRVMNQNQASSAPTAEIVGFCDEMIAWCETQIVAFATRIAELLEADPALAGAGGTAAARCRALGRSAGPG